MVYQYEGCDAVCRNSGGDSIVCSQESQGDSKEGDSVEFSNFTRVNVATERFKIRFKGRFSVEGPPEAFRQSRWFRKFLRSTQRFQARRFRVKSCPESPLYPESLATEEIHVFPTIQTTIQSATIQSQIVPRIVRELCTLPVTKYESSAIWQFMVDDSACHCRQGLRRWKFQAP